MSGVSFLRFSFSTIFVSSMLCTTVLIMGESGIGKSETALELIKRGHRLVTDDVVEIHKVSDDSLVGRSPEINSGGQAPRSSSG